MRDRAVGAGAGLAVGNAVATTLEFKARGTCEPLADMAGGEFWLESGGWTDDTANDYTRNLPAAPRLMC